MDYPIPAGEEQRLATLKNYEIMDSAPEICFDEITELAAEILQCPVSFIEFMDADRQWFKSKYGLTDDYIETPRDIAICATTICQSDLLTVNDLTEDDRFANNPLVSSAPNIRFYAGMPLISPDGAAVGTICAVDFEKREISQSQKEALRRLSRQVMAQLELRRALKDADKAVKSREELYQALLNEKQALDQFMVNMLPASIAEELKRDGKVEPKYIDEASIMFCDFVGFTKLTETMSPQNLIDLLHQCFCKFDSIVAKHGVEKIKTIGDAYMCVAGATGDQEDHATRLCMAALEMIGYLNKTNRTREKLRMPTWDMRVGIHSGPVIAGVVGENKFTFDVWGDAVNIAALMEQNSERGRVNISESTQHRVSQQFQLEDRGLVPTRKKGDLRMFFVS
ncbi:MAG: hypothetical protein CBC19_08530 [Oceanospirillales bacterium TMED59]|jgi:adenylate cyclase|nr:MAG: hypothetical protein CBC19_08530 [Oceanospirillales bacterium TMED59]